VVFAVFNTITSVTSTLLQEEDEEGFRLCHQVDDAKNPIANRTELPSVDNSESRS
jgi:hypothetical protein